MPTYEYACDRCGIVEVFQSIKAAALTKCPQCKTGGVFCLISGGNGVMFIGTGFWETDYNRSKDYASKQKSESSCAAAPTAKADAPAQAATPAKADTASDAKPAKAAAKPAETSKPTKTPATKPPAE